MSNDKTEERAAFEAWYEGKLADHMPAAWEAWQARAALSSRPVQGGWKTLTIPTEWTPGPNQFKDWCAQWFGPDSDDDYLMRAVNALVSALSSAPAQPVREPMTDAQIDRAARQMASLFDYPWEHMPGQGRSTMRKNVVKVFEAALSQSHHGITKE